MQFFINSLVSGSVIALPALAAQAVYLPPRVIFMGLAGVYSATPFIAHALQKAGAPDWLAMLVALGAAVLLSLLSEWANRAPLARCRASGVGHLVASVDVYIVLDQIVTEICGTNARTQRAGIDRVRRLGEVVLTGPSGSHSGRRWRRSGRGFGIFPMSSNLGLRIRDLADKLTKPSLRQTNPGNAANLATITANEMFPKTFFFKPIPT